MSNLSELLPTGGGQNSVDFVASGTLSSGQTVVLKSDGTVEAVAIAQSFGSPTLFTTNWTSNISPVYDSANGKVVIAYRDIDDSNYGKAIVGTVSGTSISFGAPVVFNSGYSIYQSATYDSANGKVVIAYRDNSNSRYGTAIVGTVSGTSISFGAPAIFNSSDSSDIASTYDSANGKHVIAFKERDISPAYGRAIVGTVSGTSISFGSKVTWFTPGDANDITATYDSANGKVVLGAGLSSSYQVSVGTVSGTSISFGSLVQAVATNFNWAESVYDPNSGKIIMLYQDLNNSSYGTAVVGTVSGTTMSFGSPVVFESASTYAIGGIYNPIDNTIVVVYGDSGNAGRGTLIIGTVSGNSISFGSPTVFNTTSTGSCCGVYDPNNQKIPIFYGQSTIDSESVVFQPPISNSADFIGITAEAISNGATGPVNVYGGINEAQTGLTIGADYYVQDDGSIFTIVSAVKVGKAISATTINMKDLT
jgi:hypothetical protein